MTYEEYRWVKSHVEYYYQCKIFDAHIGKPNRQYMASAPYGKSKYPIYCKLYQLFNSKLYKVLK